MVHPFDEDGSATGSVPSSVNAPFVAMPFGPGSFLFLVVRPGAPSSFLFLIASCYVRSDALATTSCKALSY